MWKIVWKNGGEKVKIKKSDLKDPYLVAKKIQDAGFYDGDLYSLPGINMETGYIEDEKNIEKKTKVTKKTTDSSKTNSNDFIKKLKQLNDLYKQGVLTKEEFTKAKNKILDNN